MFAKPCPESQSCAQDDSATAALAEVTASENRIKAEASLLLVSVGEEQVQIQSADS